MSLKAGIVGLPNVGKSTLFNAITNSNVEAANYPFATIEPNLGVVKVNDERLYKLASLVDSDKITPALCYFTDIAGLVKGASNGEGLGNQFLANIKETNVICHVVRCFNDSNITHVTTTIDPIRDCEIINTELFLSDLQSMQKRMAKVNSNAKTLKDEFIFEQKVCVKIIDFIEKEQFIVKENFNEEEWVIVNSYNLLTAKKIIYIANIDDTDITSPENNENYVKFKKYIGGKNIILPIAINIEYEISKLNDDEKKIFMKELGIEISGLDSLIKVTYDTLGIKTFFTFGKTETKAWSYFSTMNAAKCAGIIHSDIERGFIRAEVINWENLVKYGSEVKAKENGKMHIEGKDYMIQDGDVCYFRFNVSKK